MKHKKRQTKGIALLLSFVMLFSALCIPSFASETETEKDNSNNLVIGQNEKIQKNIPSEAQDDVLWYRELYIQNLDGTYGRALYGQGGWASPDSLVEISADDFDSQEVWELILGDHVIFDENHLDNRLSATAGEAGPDNPLKIYYKLPYTVTYEYEGDVPDGAPNLPETSYATYIDEITVEPAPTMDGYTFSGWEVKSPTGIDITDGTFQMPKDNVVLSGTWTKEEIPTEPVTWWYQVYYQSPSGGWIRYQLRKGGQASADTQVSISTDMFDGTKIDSTGGIFGKEYVFDADNPKTRLSAKAGEATKDNPLTIYYKLYSVTYEYEAPIPQGAPKLPETWYTWEGDTVEVAPAPKMDGYTFSGWEVKSPTGIDITDGTFKMPKDNVVLSGKWDKASTPVDPKAAVYKVEHYKQTDSNSYTLSDTDFPLYGEIGKTVTATPKDYEGYSVNQEKSIMSGTVIKPVEENGEVKYLVLEVYYDKDQTPTPPDPENPDPDKPDRPNRPDPDDPDRPSRPDSDKSDKPNKPESSQPSAPDREEVDSNRKPQQNNQTEQKPNPETGDSTSLALCLGLLAISSVGMIAAMPKRKK